MTLQWEMAASWAPWVEEQIAPHLRVGAVSRWRRQRSTLRDADVDDGVWLDDLLAPELNVEIPDFVAKLALFRGVKYIEAVHGTRLPDAAVIHREGIQPASWHRRELLLEEALRFHRVPQAAADKLRAKFAERRDRDRDIDTGKWFAMLDSRVLLRQCGHYVLLGSEWLAGLFCHCGLDFVRRGVPTVFRLAVPIGSIPDYSTDALAKDLLREWVRLSTLQRQTVRLLDHSLIMRSPLEPAGVTGHFHPRSIVDPHRDLTLVRNRKTVCPACSSIGGAYV